MKKNGANDRSGAHSGGTRANPRCFWAAPGHTWGVERNRQALVARRCWAALVAGLGALPGARGADLLWISELGGFFHEPKNWSLTLSPGPNDDARFSYRDATYTTLFGAGGSVRRLEVGRGNVTFDMQSQTITALLVSSTDGPGLRVADDAGQTSSLTVRGPGRVVAAEGAIATAPGARADLALQSAARINISGLFRMGGSGPGAGSAHVSLNSGTRIMAASATLGSSSTLAGRGVVQAALTNAGTIDPGGAGENGTLTVQGSFNQAATGALTIDVGAGSPAPLADRLAVTGAADLAGSLVVAFLPSYSPSFGDTFTILTAASITGEFTSVTGPALEGVSLVVSYTPTAVTLTVVPAPGVAGLFAVAAIVRRRVRSRG